ncbi:MAG: DNA-formamidopyrimidine glycosylase family protein [Spirochaetota bacterium]
MPELPDLLVIQKRIAPELIGRVIEAATVSEPIVLRILEHGDFKDLLAGQRIRDFRRHGPFLRLELERHDLVMHLMLAGRLRLGLREEKRLAHTAFTLELDAQGRLSYGDEKNMGKVYLCPKGCFESIPGYLSQGIDITGGDFSWELFSVLIDGKRNQARVFIMDQRILSAIGNAYADEILFEAGIHPKTPCCKLLEAEKHKLFEAIGSVIAWGTDEVEKAQRPTEDKVRGHMRVRNRGGQACPRCGATIRKAGVLGFDSFFCPGCQSDRTGRGLDWNKLSAVQPPVPQAAPPGKKGS